MAEKKFITTSFWARCPFCSNQGTQRDHPFNEPDVYFCDHCHKTFKVLELEVEPDE